MMEVVVCREVDRPDSSAYANAQGVPLLLVGIVPATLVPLLMLMLSLSLVCAHPNCVIVLFC